MMAMLMMMTKVMVLVMMRMNDDDDGNDDGDDDVDCDDDGLLRFLRVFDCFKRLRHDAVVGSNHDDRNIGNARATLAHV